MRFQIAALTILLQAINIEAFSFQGSHQGKLRRNAFPLNLSPSDIESLSNNAKNINLNDVILQPVDDFLHSIDAVTDQMIQDLFRIISSNYEQVTTTTSNVIGGNAIVQDLIAGFSQRQQQFIENSGLLSGLQQRIEEFLTLNPEAQNLIEKLLNLPPSVQIFGSAVVTYVLTSSALNSVADEGVSPEKPYPLNKYDADAAAAYFSSRPLLVLSRALQVLSTSAKFGTDLAMDILTDKFDENSDVRSIELAELLTTLGPSFIKIGQSLSIRTDILTPAYVRGLKTLQDQVPAFSTEEARKIIEGEIGSKLESIFETPFPSEPIAAASLGQVYRVKIKSDGREVALKVQRPDIMNQIALDMFLIREIAAPFLRRTFNLNTDLVGVTDTWGIGFVDELDYQEEAANGKFFTESIQNTPLGNVVFAPSVVDEYSTEKVLTSEWIVGERLDKSSKSDVTILCSIAMNSYLTMMLETGVLHCDPHPGNLLRTEDGRLCILDWGMVTRLDKDLQVTLIEHMAHLTSADYAEIPQDLLLLGFIPESKADLINDSGIVETLADIYGAWTEGGGVAKINVPKVVSQLQDLTATKGNLFQIPPYFAYIAKSFSVLEGIGLSNDEDYSIINECLPYVSKRLLTDKSVRTGGALSTFIFGPEKSDKDRIIDYKRAEQLVSGFADYSTSASGALLGQDRTEIKVIEEQADQILDLLLADESEELTPLQEIFLEQLAKIISSGSRGVWNRIREASGTLPTGRSVLGTIVDPLGLWRSSPAIALSEKDAETINTTRSLIKLLQDNSGVQNAQDLTDQLTNEQIVEIMQVISRKLWTRRSGIFRTGRKLSLNLIQLTADKLESGERVSVPSLPIAVETKVNDGKIHSDDKPRESRSLRLQNARQLMDELQREDDVVVPVPVSLTKSQNVNDDGS